jgi:hypothetical protein
MTLDLTHSMYTLLWGNSTIRYVSPFFAHDKVMDIAATTIYYSCTCIQ